MRRFMAAIFVICACSASPIRADQPAAPERANCITHCGMLAKTSNCEMLQEMETRTLAAFEKHLPEWEHRWACQQLIGWRVQLHKPNAADRKKCETGWWSESKGYCVIGMAWSQSKVIELLTFDWDAEICALSHEMAHVMDFGVNYEGEHCRWGSRGVKAALLELKGVPDLTEELCPLEKP